MSKFAGNIPLFHSMRFARRMYLKWRCADDRNHPQQPQQQKKKNDNKWQKVSALNLMIKSWNWKHTFQPRRWQCVQAKRQAMCRRISMTFSSILLSSHTWETFFTKTMLKRVSYVAIENGKQKVKYIRQKKNTNVLRHRRKRENILCLTSFLIYWTNYNP